MALSSFFKQHREQSLAVLFLLVLSYFTFVHNFWNPAALFWDENYHIASAQKYINGVYFMEPHPPLGKLMIAAGEVLLDRNPLDNQFIGTDYATNPPEKFSFLGYRFFPVMLAWLTVPLLFGVFYIITKNTLWSVLLSFLYVFDNALIVHSRSAMLESTMVFFSVLTILGFLLLRENKDNPKKLRNASILFGASFAAALATKAFALLFVMLIPFALYFLWPNLKKCWKFLWIGALSFAIVYCGIWQIHFSRGTRIEPSLPDAGYYQASPEYKEILAQGETSSPFSFPTMLRDSLKFVSHYQKGVPRLDLAKPDENGSPWYLWPIGARTINYRWETPDGNAYRYLYLQSNPVVWGLGFLGVILSFSLLAGSVFNGIKLKQPFLLVTFFTLYVCYMAAVSRIDRVMYLYHYFLPLIFSFILFGLAFVEIQQFANRKITDERKTNVLLALGVLMFFAFQFFRAFTYYELIGDKAFARRQWLRTWELRCVHCTQDSPTVVPRN